MINEQSVLMFISNQLIIVPINNGKVYYFAEINIWFPEAFFAIEQYLKFTW